MFNPQYMVPCLPPMTPRLILVNRCLSHLMCLFSLESGMPHIVQPLMRSSGSAIIVAMSNVSLSDAVYNMIELIKDDHFGGWVGGSQGMVSD